MVFLPGTFYRRNADRVVYRCEAVRESRVLLHSADVVSQAACDRRIVSRDVPDDAWTEIAAGDEGPFLATYVRDAVSEYSAEIGDDAIVYRRQYHIDPYMKPVGDEEIRGRLATIADNSIRFDANGAVRIADTATGYWARKREEIVEEIRASGRESLVQPHIGAPNRKIVRAAFDIREKKDYATYAPWGRIPAVPSCDGPGLFKFDKYEHLSRTYEAGIIRVSPVASYADKSLNAARVDSNEGRLILRPWTSGFAVVIMNQDNEVVFDTSADRIDQMAIELGGDIPFFTWCCSETFEPRLFVDFQADACLIVRDHQAFARRLNAALLAAYGALPLMHSGPVRYYDPLCPDQDLAQTMQRPLSWAFLKDWRYTYQAEYRFVWPADRGANLRSVDVTLGPLGDICDLIRLADPPKG